MLQLGLIVDTLVGIICLGIYLGRGEARVGAGGAGDRFSPRCLLVRWPPPAHSADAAGRRRAIPECGFGRGEILRGGLDLARGYGTDHHSKEGKG